MDVLILQLPVTEQGGRAWGQRRIQYHRTVILYFSFFGVQVYKFLNCSRTQACGHVRDSFNSRNVWKLQGQLVRKQSREVYFCLDGRAWVGSDEVEVHSNATSATRCNIKGPYVMVISARLGPLFGTKGDGRQDHRLGKSALGDRDTVVGLTLHWSQAIWLFGSCIILHSPLSGKDPMFQLQCSLWSPCCKDAWTFID